MAKISYNLEAKLKKLRKSARASFLAGNSVKVTSLSLGLSESILQEWHDEMVVDVLRSGSAKRLFLRDMLLKNSPTMILILAKMAQQQGDEKLAYSAASAVLSFASRFMNEDLKISNMEEKAKADTGNDPMFKKTLFDFRDPDVDGATINENAVMKKKTEELSPELLAFLHSMDEETVSEDSSSDTYGQQQITSTSLFDGLTDEEIPD